MSLKLYANLTSQPSRAVAWLLKAKSVNFDLVFTLPPKKLPDNFYEMNPNGTIPVLQDGSFYLYESNAILIYLSEKHQWSDMYPTDLQQRAKVNEYLHWHHGKVRPCTTEVFRPYLMRGVGRATEKDLNMIAGKQEKLDGIMDHIEKRLDTGYVGRTSAPTIADIACFCELDQLEIMGVYDFQPFPKISTWMEKMKQVPGHDQAHEPLHAFLTKFNMHPVSDP